jgi:hypothetical protein
MLNYDLLWQQAKQVLQVDIRHRRRQQLHKENKYA